MRESIIRFINDLQRHFPKRHETPEAEMEYFRDWVRNLKNYSDEVIVEASQELIDTRKISRPVTVAEAKEAITKVTRRKEINKPRDLEMEHAKPGDQIKAWFVGSKFVKTLVFDAKPEVAKRAAREGWIGGLVWFVRNKHRLPQPHENAKCRREAAGFDRAYRQCVKGGWDQAKALERYGSNILKKREEMARIVLGKEYNPDKISNVPENESPEEFDWRKAQLSPDDYERAQKARAWRERAKAECGSVDAFLIKHRREETA